MRNTLIKLAGTVVFMLGTGALALSVPVDAKLGKLVRFVTFHGASTWVSMMLFAIVGVVAIAYLATRREGVFRWESAIRYVALPLWAVNTGLGMLSSKLAWGAINWPEPRLQASFWIVMTAAAVLVAQFLIDRPWVAAILDVAFAGGFWALLMSARNLMHPDNPVLNSGWDIKGPFVGMVVAWACAMGLAAWAVRDRLVVWHASAPDADAGAVGAPLGPAE